MIEITSYSDDHLRHVLANLAPDDRAELKAARLSHRSFQTFSKAAEEATECAVILAAREPICVYGIQPHPREPDHGIPWMVVTPTFQSHPKAMCRIAQGVIARWRSQFRLIGNLVHCRHSRAIRFLDWLGFTVEPVGIGPRNAFYAFWIGESRV
jgi:hypothetical protein